MIQYREADGRDSEVVWTFRAYCVGVFIRISPTDPLSDADIQRMYEVYDWLDSNVGFKGWDVERGIIGVIEPNGAMAFKLRWC